jgi:hypothetical protein
MYNGNRKVSMTASLKSQRSVYSKMFGRALPTRRKSSALFDTAGIETTQSAVDSASRSHRRHNGIHNNNILNHVDLPPIVSESREDTLPAISSGSISLHSSHMHGNSRSLAPVDDFEGNLSAKKHSVGSVSSRLVHIWQLCPHTRRQL